MLHVSVRIYDALSVTHRTQPTTHVEIEWKSWKAYSGFWFDSHFSLLFLALKLSIVYPALYTTVRLAFGYDICLRVNVHLFNFNKSHSLLRNVSKGNGGIKRAKQTHTKKTPTNRQKAQSTIYFSVKMSEIRQILRGDAKCFWSWISAGSSENLVHGSTHWLTLRDYFRWIFWTLWEFGYHFKTDE